MPNTVTQYQKTSFAQNSTTLGTKDTPKTRARRSISTPVATGWPSTIDSIDKLSGNIINLSRLINLFIKNPKDFPVGILFKKAMPLLKDSNAQLRAIAGKTISYEKNRARRSCGEQDTYDPQAVYKQWGADPEDMVYVHNIEDTLSAIHDTMNIACDAPILSDSKIDWLLVYYAHVDDDLFNEKGVSIPETVHIFRALMNSTTTASDTLRNIRNVFVQTDSVMTKSQRKVLLLYGSIISQMEERLSIDYLYEPYRRFNNALGEMGIRLD